MSGSIGKSIGETTGTRRSHSVTGYRGAEYGWEMKVGFDGGMSCRRREAKVNITPIYEITGSRDRRDLTDSTRPQLSSFTEGSHHLALRTTLSSAPKSDPSFKPFSRRTKPSQSLGSTLGLPEYYHLGLHNHTRVSNRLLETFSRPLLLVPIAL